MHYLVGPLYGIANGVKDYGQKLATKGDLRVYKLSNSSNSGKILPKALKNIAESYATFNKKGDLVKLSYSEKNNDYKTVFDALDKKISMWKTSNELYSPCLNKVTQDLENNKIKVLQLIKNGDNTFTAIYENSNDLSPYITKTLKKGESVPKEWIA